MKTFGVLILQILQINVNTFHYITSKSHIYNITTNKYHQKSLLSFRKLLPSQWYIQFFKFWFFTWKVKFYQAHFIFKNHRSLSVIFWSKNNVLWKTWLVQLTIQTILQVFFFKITILLLNVKVFYKNYSSPRIKILKVN